MKSWWASYQSFPFPSVDSIKPCVYIYKCNLFKILFDVKLTPSLLSCFLSFYIVTYEVLTHLLFVAELCDQWPMLWTAPTCRPRFVEGTIEHQSPSCCCSYTDINSLLLQSHYRYFCSLSFSFRSRGFLRHTRKGLQDIETWKVRVFF